MTSDALHTVRANLGLAEGQEQEGSLHPRSWKKNQPLLHVRVKALPWRQVPGGSTAREAGHGRIETRTLKAAHVSRLDFPHARQAIKITRWRKDTSTGKVSREERLRHHRPHQRRRHRGGSGPPGPRALVHRGAPPRPFSRGGPGRCIMWRRRDTDGF